MYSTMSNLAKYLEDSERLKEKVKNLYNKAPKWMKWIMDRAGIISNLGNDELMDSMR